MLYEVILDTHETPNKCTIAAILPYRKDFQVFHTKGGGVLGPLRSPLLLHPEGECLTKLRSSLGVVSGIATIDCIWSRVETLLGRIVDPKPQLARIPDGFKTAYPRKSKKNL